MSNATLDEQRQLAAAGFYKGKLDGDEGPLTRRARRLRQASKISAFPGAAEPTPAAIEALPPGKLLVSRRAVDLIVRCEITSAAFYEKHSQAPEWPEGASGVTIGIGYDLGYVTHQQFLADWADVLVPAVCRRLDAVVGLKGHAAAAALRGLRDIRIPYLMAEQVFETRTLQAIAQETRAAFPGIEKLPPDAQGAIASLDYNRGPSMTKPSMESRSEMRAIRTLVRDCRWAVLCNVERQEILEDLGDLLESMCRLWVDNPRSDGDLCDRRRQEASLVRNALRVYQVGELMVI